MLIQVGSAETLLDDAIGFGERALGAGVEVELEVWEEMFHVFQIVTPFLPEAEDAIARIGEFLAEKLR